jgi:hypothetical protein
VSMRSVLSQNGKLIMLVILSVVLVFIIPLQFAVEIGTDSSQYFIYNQAFYFLSATGTMPYTRFRETLTQYPLSLILALASVAFRLRLHQQEKRTYPLFSAFAITLALWCVPIYFLIQFFSVDMYNWLNIAMTAPISMGFCSILFLVFFILPSIAWYSNHALPITSALTTKNDESLVKRKKAILTPKRGSIIVFLAAFLLPGIIFWQGQSGSEASDLNMVCVSVLVQLVTFYIGGASLTIDQSYTFYVQEMAMWDFIGIPMLCCVLILVFAWSVMRYVHGKGHRTRTLIIGAISEIPPIVYVVATFTSGSPWSAIPLPAALVVGLLVMHFTPVEEPKPKVGLTDDEITVPLRIRLKSRFSRHGEAVEKQQETVISSDEKENQASRNGAEGEI